MAAPRPNLQTAEHERLRANAQLPVPIERWGPYLSERQWGTVREDYSAHGNAWGYLTHDMSRSKAYRWGEDGIGGLCDRSQFICFAITLWNYKDPILKERLFGLANGEGNHGEDCKELYYYLDNLPTHSYMKFLYKYPQAAFPYDLLVGENAARSKEAPEYELLDTGVFDTGQYFDTLIEYAKFESEDIAIRITITNRGINEAPVMLLPTAWFRNTWQENPANKRPSLKLSDQPGQPRIEINHHTEGRYYLYLDEAFDKVLFTENETNTQRLYGVSMQHPYTKDAFHEVIIHGNTHLLDGKSEGTKAAPVYSFVIEGGSSKVLLLRLTKNDLKGDYRQGITEIFDTRIGEADEFYETLIPEGESDDRKNIQRQAFAGLLWNKQFYHYDVNQWLDGDPGMPAPPFERLKGRNSHWRFLNNRDILLMPDSWEYPWYAAWDLAFHCIPMALLDPVFAKNQLILIMREWYMNPQGQIPAYEWNFSDVNPPVHAWAALCVYKIDKNRTGVGDIVFLKRIFSKLTINFTWWVNRKDHNGNNLFEGGFLGLDNIGIINRSDLPHGYSMEQVDGTSWMAMFALNMMEIALEIAQFDHSYEDIVTKFYEHYVLIAESLDEARLWDDEDGFYYDLLIDPHQQPASMKIHSAVGLSVLFATGMIDNQDFMHLPDLVKRIDWFRRYRQKAGRYLPSEVTMSNDSMLISLLKKDKLARILRRLLDESEFLSAGGIRSLSKFHEKYPLHLHIDGHHLSICYDPAESTTSMFGGNSNWRGPVWMPINYLLIKALKKYYQFYGEEFKVEFPTGSGNFLDLQQVARALAARAISLFEKDQSGNRPVHSDHQWFYLRPENHDLILFYEYFHGDTGRGAGASHQTGWTAVIAELINEEQWEWDE